MKKFLVVALVLVVVAVGVTVFYAGSITRRTLERGLTYALGVETNVGAISLSPLSGRFRLGGVDVANPAGFEADHFLALADGKLELDLASLREDVVHVRLVELRGLDLEVEQAGSKSNYDAILTNLERFEREDEGGAADAEEAGTAKRFRVDRLVCRDVTAHLRVTGLDSELLGIDVNVPEVLLTDVGSDADGASLGQIAAALVRQLLNASLEAGGDRTPAELYADLRARVDDGLDDARRRAEDAVDGALDDATKKLGDVLGEDAAGALGERAKGALEKGAEDLGKSLGGLLGGKKD